MTAVYAFGDEWGKSILPNNFTVQWFIELFKDKAFFSINWEVATAISHCSIHYFNCYDTECSDYLFELSKIR